MVALLLAALIGQLGTPGAFGIIECVNPGSSPTFDDVTTVDDVIAGDEITADAITLGSTVSACADAVTCVDANGVIGGQMTGTTDPTNRLLRPGVCAPGDGTCAAANLGLFAGQDTTTIDIDAFGSCAGDTVTVTVWTGGLVTINTLTEGAQWTASGSNGATATSLAAAVQALAGVGATASSAQVRITLDSTTGRVVLAESDAACTTVATGTPGFLFAVGSIRVYEAPGSNGFADFTFSAGGTLNIGTVDGTARLQLSGSAVTSVQPLVGSSTITSSRTSDLGWAVVDGTDNTACTSQCTSAAVFGLNLAAGATAPVIVGPSDATADICLCAGAT